MSKSVPPPGAGPWRILILDPDPADPKWILATVDGPAAVRPAWPASTPPALAEATSWIRDQTGDPAATLSPMRHAAAWHIEDGEHGPRSPGKRPDG